MIKRQLANFCLRWVISSIAMYICIVLFGAFRDGSDPTHASFGFYLLAGLVFSLVNCIVRPIATIFALPLLFLTLGVFTVILNAAMVALTVWIIPDITMSFGGAIGSCLIISLINYLANLMISDVK